MSELDYIDLEILYRAKKSENGTSPETINLPAVFTPSIWELADKFTLLQEKNLLSKNQDGKFELTKKGINTFWDVELPLKLNLLKLLQIKALSDTQCAMYLEEPLPAVQQALELNRKKGYVLMSPLRKDQKLLKMYELLPEGVQQITQYSKSSMQVVKVGEKLIVELKDGEGILYEIIDDLTNPLRMIKTVSKDEIKEYK